eukprot:6201559-Pleurochrysis_carterae.AAC.1
MAALDDISAPCFEVDSNYLADEDAHGVCNPTLVFGANHTSCKSGLAAVCPAGSSFRHFVVEASADFRSQEVVAVLPLFSWSWVRNIGSC